jgi:hypothetical protein
MNPNKPKDFIIANKSKFLVKIKPAGGKTQAEA